MTPVDYANSITIKTKLINYTVLNAFSYYCAVGIRILNVNAACVRVRATEKERKRERDRMIMASDVSFIPS